MVVIIKPKTSPTTPKQILKFKLTILRFVFFIGVSYHYVTKVGYGRRERHKMPRLPQKPFLNGFWFKKQVIYGFKPSNNTA